jgi:CBS domain-containing protein
MAPRAAARLESLGFDGVYEYKAGKLDWLAAGLPTDGENSKCPRAGEASRKDVVICDPKERLGDVGNRVRQSGLEVAVVVDAERIVLGLLRSKQLAMDGDLAVDQAMRPGPSTFRPYVSMKEMADYLVEHSLDSAPITTSDGKLVGILLKSDATRMAADAAACTRKLISDDTGPEI